MQFEHSLCEGILAVETSTGLDDLKAAVSTIANKLGFTHWAFGARPRVCRDISEIVTVDTYPVGWMDHYKDNNYLAADSSISLAVRTRGLIDWAEAARVGPPALWDDAESIGLRYGLACPSWNESAAFGLLSLARDGSPITRAERAMVGPYAAWLAGVALAKILRPATPAAIADDIALLTLRECESLKWTAEGKTANEVASILGISTRTVNFHLTNAMQKLDAVNKMQAVVRAMSAGFI